MGYDLIAQSGEYFRANDWTWPAIQAVVASTGAIKGDLAEGRVLSADEANNIAIGLDRILPSVEERIEASIPEDTQEFLDEIASALPAGTTLQGLGSRGEPQATCYVSKEKLAEFAGFCRGSGGFEV